MSKNKYLKKTSPKSRKFFPEFDRAKHVIDFSKSSFSMDEFRDAMVVFSETLNEFGGGVKLTSSSFKNFIDSNLEEDMRRKLASDYYREVSQDWSATERVFRDALERDPFIMELKRIFLMQEPTNDPLGSEKLLMFVLLSLYSELNAERRNKTKTASIEVLENIRQDGDALLPGTLKMVLQQMADWDRLPNHLDAAKDLATLEKLRQEIHETKEVLSDMLELFNQREDSKNATQLQTPIHDPEDLDRPSRTTDNGSGDGEDNNAEHRLTFAELGIFGT